MRCTSAVSRLPWRRMALGRPLPLSTGYASARKQERRSYRPAAASSSSFILRRTLRPRSSRVSISTTSFFSRWTGRTSPPTPSGQSSTVYGIRAGASAFRRTSWSASGRSGPHRRAQCALSWGPSRLRSSLEQVEVLDARGGVEKHHLLIRHYCPARQKLADCRHTRTSLRRSKYSFAARHLFCPLDQLVVSDGERGPTGLADCVQDEKVPDGLRHPEASRHCCGILEFLGETIARFERAHDRCAPGGLHRDHPRSLVADPTQLLHLVERLPHSHEPRSSASRIDDHVGQGPGQLFG